MRKVSEILDKNFIYAIWAFLFISVIVNFRSCGVSKDNRRLRDEVVILQAEHDSTTTAINANFYTKEQLDIRLEIHGLEVSKRMLYDQNAIVRTVIRPDDRMNEYDLKIKELRKKLNQ